MRRAELLCRGCMAILALVGSATCSADGEGEQASVSKLALEGQVGFDEMRQRLFDAIVGTSDLNLNDPDVRLSIESMTRGAQEDWDRLIKGPNRTCLFADASTQLPNNNVSATLLRLRNMAAQVVQPGSSLYRNQALLRDIVDALEWLNANWYSDRIRFAALGQGVANNWFEWEIYSALYLADIMVLLYDDLTPDQIKRYCDAIKHVNPDVTVVGTSLGSRWPSTGANRAWKCAAMARVGILSKDAKLLEQVRDGIGVVFPFATSGDGFYADGSFIQHGSYPYSGGYGTRQVLFTARTMYMLSGSPWQVKDPNQANVRRWLQDAYRPILFTNRGLDNLNGRNISRVSPSEVDQVAYVLLGALYLASMANATDALELRRFIKAMITSDPTFTYAHLRKDITGEMEYWTTWEASQLKAIVIDPSIKPSEPLSLYKQFPAMDRFTWLRPHYAFSAAMYSDRISNYESINDENLQGWHTNDGRTTLRTADVTQFEDFFWGTVDMYRLPGTTVRRFAVQDIQSPQVGRVDLASRELALTDELEDWSKTHFRTPSWELLRRAHAPDGSTSRRTLDTEESVVYRHAKVTHAAAQVIYHQSRPPFDKVKIGFSKDATGWSTSPMTWSAPQSIGDGWMSLRVSASAPANAVFDYVRIQVLTTDSAPNQKGTESFAGGVELLGQYGVSAMKLHPVGESLTAQKSWFMFDDEVVCLGSGVRSSDEGSIETVVDNRKLDAPLGANVFLVNGLEVPNALGWFGTMTDSRWAHVQGNVLGADVGYFFPGGATLRGLRETRTASWNQLSHKSEAMQSGLTFSKTFLTFWLDHGPKPSGARYAYVLLPDRSSAQTQSYAGHPDITVESLDERVHAVRERKQGLWGAVFWEDGPAKVAGVTVHQKAVMMLRQADGFTELSIADPTFKNTMGIDLDVGRAVTSFSLEAGIKVVETQPTLRLRVETNGARGRPFRATFHD